MQQKTKQKQFAFGTLIKSNIYIYIYTHAHTYTYTYIICNMKKINIVTTVFIRTVNLKFYNQSNTLTSQTYLNKISRGLHM